MKVLFRCAVPWAYACLMGAAAAQAAETAPPRAAVFDPFKHYQGWHDEPLQEWRMANERVGEIGGWRGYLRESQQEGGGPNERGNGHPRHPGEGTP